MIIELLKGFKDTYLKSDFETKAKILSVVLNKVILKGEDTYFIWKQPFGFLFDISKLAKEKGETQPFIKSALWGTVIYELRTLFMSASLNNHLKQLRLAIPA
jgi:hypothetical protein